jgi:glycosyltransferase involved in cell wall biosynthesis
MCCPKVSVIIPTCAREELLLQCVDSILHGTFSDFEILIIDQDSHGHLKKRLAEQFPDYSSLRYFFLSNAGASRARNFGLQQAKGEVMAFIDDDAIATPGWLAGIAETFVTIQPRPTLMAGRIKPVWPDSDRPKWYPQEREFLLGLYDIGSELRLMPEHDQPIGANMAGLREIIISLGGFDEELGPNYFRKHSMLTGEEAILSQRARRAGHLIYYQPKAEVYHHISTTKLTRRYFLRRHFWEGVTVITELKLLGDLGERKIDHIRYHLIRIIKSFVLYTLPSLQNRFSEPPAAVRMLALAKAAYSLGVLYGLSTPNELR